MNFWANWSWFEFFCYSGIIFLLSSYLTARYMLKNKKRIDDIEKDLSRRVSLYKLEDGSKWHIRFHKHGTTPGNTQKRIYPPLHAGGPKKMYPEDDDAFHMINEEDISFKEAWENVRHKYYSDEEWDSLDPIEKDLEYDRFRKRMEYRFRR